MPLTEAFEGTNGTWATEYSLPGEAAYSSGSPQTTDGIYSLWLDGTNIAFGDMYRLKAYEKVRSGDTQQRFMQFNLRYPRAYVLPPVMLLHGWDFTLQRISGSDRTITWGGRLLPGTPSEAFSGAPTVGTTEYYLASASTTKTQRTTDVMAQLFVDCANLVKGDEFVLKVYDEARDADSTDRAFEDVLLSGVRTLDTYLWPGLPTMNAWEFSLDRIAGADRAMAYSIRTVT